MKIFLSYGHDSNVPLIERIKDFLSKDADGNPKHDVWIDTSEIKVGKDWHDDLPENEKDFNRNTAAETLKLILKLRWKIEKSEI